MNQTGQEAKTVELDVRPILLKKEEPFAVIMDTVKELKNKGDTLVLHATFKPEPLLRVLKGKGFYGETEELAADHWKVTFVHE